jgi:hypothetical protein
VLATKKQGAAVGIGEKGQTRLLQTGIVQKVRVLTKRSVGVCWIVSRRREVGGQKDNSVLLAEGLM